MSAGFPLFVSGVSEVVDEVLVGSADDATLLAGVVEAVDAGGGPTVRAADGKKGRENIRGKRVGRIFVTRLHGLTQRLQAWETLEGVPVWRAWAIQASGTVVCVWSVAAIWALRGSPSLRLDG